jgi:hypothetical protein
MEFVSCKRINILLFVDGLFPQQEIEFRSAENSELFEAGDS